MQFITASKEPADNLSNLYYITEFLNDSVIAMGYAPDNSFHNDTAEGMSCILRIISHDLKVMADTLPPFITGFRKRKSEA